MDAIMLGFYYILNKTLYLEHKERTFGPKEHALTMSLTVHSLNLYSLVKPMMNVIDIRIAVAILVILTLALATILCYVYFIHRRMNQLLLKQSSWKIRLARVLITGLYTYCSIFIFLNY